MQNGEDKKIGASLKQTALYSLAWFSRYANEQFLILIHKNLLKLQSNDANAVYLLRCISVTQQWKYQIYLLRCISVT